MTYLNAAAAVEARIETWATAQSLDVQWPNGAYAPTGRAWCRVQFFGLEASRASLGAPAVYRHPALLIVSVFVPLGEGSGNAYTFADALCAAFRGVTADTGIRYRAPTVTDIGERDGFYQVNVTVPFVRDTIF